MISVFKQAVETIRMRFASVWLRGLRQREDGKAPFGEGECAEQHGRVEEVAGQRPGPLLDGAKMPWIIILSRRES